MCFLCSFFFLLLLLLLFGPSTRVGFNPTASHIKGPSRIVFLPTQVHGGDVRRLPGCYPENIPHCFSVTSVMFRFFFSRQHLLSQLLWTMLIYKSNFVYLARWRSTSPSLNLSAGEISRVKSLYGQANRHKKIFNGVESRRLLRPSTNPSIRTLWRRRVRSELPQSRNEAETSVSGHYESKA